MVHLWTVTLLVLSNRRGIARTNVDAFTIILPNPRVVHRASIDSHEGRSHVNMDPFLANIIHGALAEGDVVRIFDENSLIPVGDSKSGERKVAGIFNLHAPVVNPGPWNSDTLLLGTPARQWALRKYPLAL